MYVCLKNMEGNVQGTNLGLAGGAKINYFIYDNHIYTFL